MTNQISTILIKYTAQSISKSDKCYYKELIDYFSTLPIKELSNQICEYTELTMAQIKNEEFILNKISSKVEEVDYE